MSDVSTKEKSLLASLFITLLVFGNFFVDILEVVLSGEPMASVGTSLVAAVISGIILEIIAQSLLASLRASQKDDERDRLIERMSFRNGYLCLSVGLWIWIAQSTIPTWWTDLPSSSYMTGALVPVLLLLLFVIAEVTMTVTRLFYYRHGL